MTEAQQVADATQDDGLIEPTNNAGEAGQPELDQSPDTVVVGDAVEGQPVPEETDDPAYLAALGVPQDDPAVQA